ADCRHRGDRAVGHGLSAAARAGEGRILRSAALCHGRHGLHGGVGGADHDLHRAGDQLDRHLRAVRLPPPQLPLHRGLAQVLPAGVVRHRLLPLWHCPALRGQRHHQSVSDGQPGPAHLPRRYQPRWPVLAAAGLMFIGLGFKVSAAPYQMWTPDVYEGAPALVTGFMSAGPKAAAFAVALRVFYVALQDSSATWFWMIWAAAILSMCL